MLKLNNCKSYLKLEIPLYLIICYYQITKDLLQSFRPYPSALVDLLSVTALTLRVVMARLSVRVCMSTDLASDVYIQTASPPTQIFTRHRLSMIHSHLVPRTLTVGTYCDSILCQYLRLWQGFISTVLKLYFQSYNPILGGILTLVLRQCQLSKISVKSKFLSRPLRFLSKSTSSQLQGVYPAGYVSVST